MGQPILTPLRSRVKTTPSPLHPFAKSKTLNLAMWRKTQVRKPYF